MKSFVSATFLVLYAACVLAQDVDDAAAKTFFTSSISAVNPYKGFTQFVSPTYRPKVHAAAQVIKKAGNAALAKKALKVAEGTAVPTWLWLSDIASIGSLEGWLREARITQFKTRKPTVVQIEVYNLPDRDCSAKASSGELVVAEGGEEKYKKTFIDPIVKILRKYPDLRIVLGLETDATGNIVSNQSVEKCANAKDAQLRSVAYAIAAFQLPNVALYLDGAHAAWLGWPGNIDQTAVVIGQLVKDAQAINPKAKIRGIATNVSNYNGLGNQNQTGYDELVYVRNLQPLLAAQGVDAHFIVDQGRSGNQAYTRSGQSWCNNKNAGFGPRPTSKTGYEDVLDAIVWVKPGGEADGTSDETAVRYDEACGSETSLKPAPEAGTWFQAYFEQLLTNADPAF
ncbi:putative cellulose 1,4-beta-cellobiosidase II precursor [Auriculariales sp. MPI-PUGE-AT-0066]|nr:putative cellulose 1,4-beta-cellobiosidase II precursor [Auriculariales sp. MPI-PUGE-AT-0066]